MQARWNGGTPRPQIIFEGNSSADFESSQALHTLLKKTFAAAPGAPLRAYLGEPVAIKDAVSANFRRQSGGNLLIVIRNEEEARGMFAAGLLSLLLQLPRPQTSSSFTHVYILDFSPVDAPHAQLLKQISELSPSAVKLGRRNQIQDYLTTIAQEVDRRIETEESASPSVFLLIYGLHKARDIRQEEDFGYSSMDEPEAFNPAKVLATILRQGPEVGLHTIVWSDTVASLQRSLERRVLREFGMRVVSQMSTDDSVELLDTPAAGKLGPHRALFLDDEENRLEKLRPYLPLSLERVEAVRANVISGE